MPLTFHGLPSAQVNAIRTSGQDAYGNPIEHHISDGSAFLCRHCLGRIAKGEPYLALAYRPFETQNPYAETGPLFLCADCQGAAPTDHPPAVLDSESYLIKGYTADERILYGTGKTVPNAEISSHIEQMFENPAVAFADIRSSMNNCYQCRVTRG
ncbi:MAG: DUF1203 domain-containing protein [Paracoccaceae bacterium]